MATVMPSYRNLLDVLPKNVEMGGFCDRDYTAWEQNVAALELVKLGYTVIGWTTGEADSFGPLSRIVTVVRCGQFHQFIYG